MGSKTRRWWRLSTVALAAVLVCASAPALAEAKPCTRPSGAAFRDAHWQVDGPGHPLLGQVLKGTMPIAIEAGPCTRTPLQQLMAEIWRTIRAGGVVLLGEVHDNPQHHLVRADLLWPRLERIAPTEGLRPAAVFEHIRADQQERVAHFYEQASRNRRLRTASDLLLALGWRESGWPAAEIFHPLYNAALRARLPILAGDPPRERIKRLARGDRSLLQEDDLDLLKVSETLPQLLVDALTDELVSSHCGAMPASAFGGMNLAQRYRDAHLAGALLKAADKHGAAFLLAGNGHVRTDRGVPWYVRQMAPGRKVLSVMLIEVEEGKTDPVAYVPRAGAGKPTADYILFTPRHIRSDPCEKMRQGRQ